MSTRTGACQDEDHDRCTGWSTYRPDHHDRPSRKCGCGCHKNRAEGKAGTSSK